MRGFPRLVAGLVAVGSCSPGLAQVPAGPTFQVNPPSGEWEYSTRVAVRPNGDFVMVWCNSIGTPLLGRTFDAATGAGGAVFQVNSGGSGVDCVDAPPPFHLAGGDDGFVVTWQSPSPERVIAHRYNWSGQALGSEFQVATTPFVDPFPAVAVAPDGNFMVVWAQEEVGVGRRIHARRYDAQGNAVGVEFRVGTSVSDELIASAAAAVDGRMVVVWTRLNGGFGRRLDASGTPVGAEFQVTGSPGFASEWAVAVEETGFMVVWEHLSAGQRVVLGRAFDDNGNPLSPQITISAVEGTGPSRHPAVARYGPQRYVVSWFEGGGADTPKKARVFDLSGVPHGAEFMVTTTPDYYGPQAPNPQVATDAVGNMTFGWTRLMDFQVAGKDVMGRRFYGGLIPRTLAVDAVAGPSSNGNRVLEACETVPVRPAWSNDTASTHSLTGALTAFTGPAGATYTIVDGAASYGALGDGDSADCGGDCYSVAVSCAPTRPAMHWDTRLTETLAPVPQNGRFALHVGESFQDVPRTSPYYRFVETLLHEGITAGCGPSLYCPSSPVTREQMAVFVLLAKEEPDFKPESCYGTSPFSDVSPGSPTCPYIKAVARRGIASGCGAGLFCPTDPVTREQMPVFVLKTLDPALIPPDCTTPLFNDVPASDPFCRWIEELARRQVVSGCGGGKYCPAAPVTREQMAVFLGASFGLTLYGP